MKTYTYVVILIVILSSFFIGANILNAQQTDQQATLSTIMSRLQQVTQNQEAIMSTLEEIKEELRIVKVRATIKRP